MKDRRIVCAGCESPIAPGEPRWAGREPDAYWHYGCAGRAGLAKPLDGERVAKEASTARAEAMPALGRERRNGASTSSQPAKGAPRLATGAAAKRNFAAKFEDRDGVER